MSRRHFPTSLFWLIFTLEAAAQSTAPPASSRAEIEGQKLAAELRAQQPAEELPTRGTLIRRDSADRRTRIPVTMRVEVGPNEWRSTYEARLAPNESEKLVVTHTADKPNQYLLTLTSPTNHTATTLSLTGDQANRPFAQTDFWASDLGLEFFHWPVQLLVTNRMRTGRSCYILESVNPHPAAGGYARVVSWIDVETHGLIQTYAYDLNRKQRKYFTIGSVKKDKVSHRYQLKEMTIWDYPNHTQTQLQFNLSVKADSSASNP